MGPIVRARDFIPQIQEPYSLNKQDFSWAIIQIVKGLIKKIVIADFILMHFIDIIVFAPDTYPGFVSVLAMWAYSLHIYADFSGYTDVAIGLSRLMGFQLKPNFNSPYKARNVADFWRRWHISLGSWLKDYLYIPLGGNRTGTVGSYIAIFIIFTFLIFITQWYELLYVYAGLTVVYFIGAATIKNFKKYVHRDLNLLITMVVGGLWHGPSQNFVIWGAMNGCALLIFKYWKDINEYLTSKSSLWYLTKGVLAFGIYSLLNIIFPATKHEALPYFFYFWMATSALAFIYHSITLKSAYHEHGKKVYTVFWQVFITFNFITLTRIWFKLDEADSDTLPLVMLNQMWNHFDFSWDLFVTVLKTYDKVFWIMLFGFIIHWLPDKVKLLWEKAFTSLSLPLQVISVAIIVVLIYQALGAEQPPFVYLQF
jgi:D-alanyl-lipoteichoic acid acyltransferase DltB (MBOAT superfamily)